MDATVGRDTNIDNRFWLIFEQAAIGVALISPKGHYLRANPELCRMLGYTEEELLALTINDLTHPEELPTSNDLWKKLLAGEIAAYRRERRYIRRDGRVVWGLVSMSVVRDDAGVPMQAVATIQDITDRKTAQIELEQIRKRSPSFVLRAVSDDIGDLISIHNLQGDFLFANAASTKLLGYTPGELVGQNLFRYINPNDLDAVYQAHKAFGEGSSAPLRVQYRALRKDGSYILLESKARPLGGARDNEREIIFISSEAQGHYAEPQLFTDNRREEGVPQQSRDLARTDALTGLSNKRYIEDIVGSRLVSPRAASFPFGVLLVEVDDFATLNDIYGQAVCNEIVRRVARTLQDTCRTEDAAARAGDHKFMIMLPTTNAGGTIVVGEKLIRSIKAIDWSDTPLQSAVSVSIGATCVTNSGLTLPELMTVLDQQLIQAKEGGRNRLVMNTKQTAQRMGKY